MVGEAQSDARKSAGGSEPQPFSSTDTISPPTLTSGWDESNDGEVLVNGYFCPIIIQLTPNVNAPSYFQILSEVAVTDNLGCEQ